MTAYIYTIGPIDAEWDYLMPLSDYLRKIDTAEAQSVLKLLAVGVRNAEHFEGDISQGPAVTFLPIDDYGMQVVVLWKQGSDGTTFAVSRCPVSTLESENIEKVVCR